MTYTMQKSIQVGGGRLELPLLAELAPKASASAISPPAHFFILKLLCDIFYLSAHSSAGRAAPS